MLGVGVSRLGLGGTSVAGVWQVFAPLRLFAVDPGSTGELRHPFLYLFYMQLLLSVSGREGSVGRCGQAGYPGEPVGSTGTGVVPVVWRQHSQVLAATAGVEGGRGRGLFLPQLFRCCVVLCCALPSCLIFQFSLWR